MLYLFRSKVSNIDKDKFKYLNVKEIKFPILNPPHLKPP